MIADGVPEALGRALARRGHHAPTPVQRAVLAAPPGRDLLVSAPTGSGKTVAYGLALAGGLLGPDGRARGDGRPRALVVTPTRELARQAGAELDWLYAGAAARVLCCVGGADPRRERAALAAGAEIVVGTPGRLRDQAARGALALGRVGAVVLDEADELLAGGFVEALAALLAGAAPGRRMLMVSATLGPRAAALAARWQRDPLWIEAGGDGGALRFEAVAVAPGERFAAVAGLLALHAAAGAAAGPPGAAAAPGALVFCGRRTAAAELAGWLAARRGGVVALSGGLEPAARLAAAAALREGAAQVCVATDLAARGLDLPGVGLVVHADLPASAAALIHRAGRTGRAGRPGRSVLVAAHPLRGRALRLAARAGVGLDWLGRAAVLAAAEGG